MEKGAYIKASRLILLNYPPSFDRFLSRHPTTGLKSYVTDILAEATRSIHNSFTTLIRLNTYMNMSEQTNRHTLQRTCEEKQNQKEEKKQRENMKKKNSGV